MSKTSTRPLEAVEDRLGYGFRNRENLQRALTHRSAVPGDRASQESYQRHEFLGDRVLALVIADMLFQAYPRSDEGDLARRLNSLVRRETCADVAADLALGEAVRLGVGERQSGGRRKEAILGDIAEAVIAAIYLDGGFNAVYPVVRHIFGPMFAEDRELIAFYDHKTQLQEIVQSRYKVTPTYHLLQSHGPDHAKTFEVEVRMQGQILAKANGSSKKDAEQSAARAAIESVQVSNS